MIGYIRLRNYALELLETELSDKLVYHGIHHTLDVLKNVNFLIRVENVNSHDAKLLRVASLYHDIGFTQVYKDHEEKGVKILKAAMLKFNCDMKNFSKMASMIMATKIPQNPKNDLEKIICDSDLFYLGKGMYYKISETLYEELKTYGFIQSEKQWKDIQVSFLSNHRYHTAYCRENLEKPKQQRVEEILSGKKS